MPEIDIDMYTYINIYFKHIGVSPGVASVYVQIADEKLTSVFTIFLLQKKISTKTHLPKHLLLFRKSLG